MLKTFFAGVLILLATAFSLHHAPVATTSTPTEPVTRVLTVVNHVSKDPIALVANTRFETNDHLIFRTPQAITIPGKHGAADGTVQITVVADQAGSQYDIGAAHFTLPGLATDKVLYHGIYAYTSGASPQASQVAAAVAAIPNISGAASGGTTGGVSNIPVNPSSLNNASTSANAVPSAPMQSSSPSVLTASVDATSYVTKGELTTQIQQATNSLRSLIYQNESVPNSLRSSGGYTNDIALTNDIDQLSGTTLNNVTVNGVSGLTAADIPTDITAGNYLPLSGGTLTGAFVSMATTSSSFAGALGIGTTSPSDVFAVNGPIYLANITPAATTNRLYSNGGSLYWAGSLIGGGATGNWSSDGTNVWRAGGNVGIGTTSPSQALSVQGNALFSGTLTLGALSGAVSAANGVVSAGTLSVGNGGTGSTTLSGVLVGNGTGALQTATISSPFTLSGTTLSIQQATAAQNGYLASTDWNTFNGKLGSSTISALTSNAIAKWTGSAFANSLITDTGTAIGIGTTSPSQALSVQGNALVSGALTAISAAFTNATSTNLYATYLSLGTPLPISSGGTGATTAATAQTNLGLGSMAIQSAGSIAVTGGSASNLTSVGTRSINLFGNTVSPGTPSSANTILYRAAALTGTSSATWSPIYISDNDSTVYTGAAYGEYLRLNHNMSPGFSGNRNTLDIQMGITGAPASTDSSTHGYTTAVLLAKASVNVGGTADNYADAVGNLWATNENAYLLNGATHWQFLVDQEDDIAVPAGASALRVANILLGRTSANVNPGIIDDAGIQFASQLGAAPIRDGIQFGADAAQFPFGSQSNGIRVVRSQAPSLGSQPALGTMIDGQAAAYTTAFIKGPNFGVNPAGQTFANGLVTTGSLQAQSGSVTALTLVARGGYTGGIYSVIPTITIDPPPAGGTQATASVATVGLGFPVIISGGSGYVDGDLLTVNGGTGTAPTIVVSTVGGSGQILTWNVGSAGSLSAVPSSPASLSGGSGSGATVSPYWSILTTAITNGGAGYPAFPPPMVWTSGYSDARVIAAQINSTITASSTSLLLNPSGGKVGIGTTSPTANLTLDSSSPNGTVMRVSNSSAGGHIYDWLSTGSANTGGAGRLDLFDFTAGAARLSIASNGNVGIGTTTPGSLLSIGNTGGIDFSTATSSFSTTGGINLSGGCFSLNGTCIGGGGGSGTVNSGTQGQLALYNVSGTTLSGTSTLSITQAGNVG